MFSSLLPPTLYFCWTGGIAVTGEWRKWNSNYWGANFVWTTLHDFGGTDGLKGKLSHINEIPFAAIEAGAKNVWGTGFTPEGIDQNPVYYEFMLETSWRTERVANITEHIVARSHRRYGFESNVAEVATAWEQLVGSAYSQDLSVQDGTGVPHLGSNEGWSWEADKHTPTSTLCMIYTAWDALIKTGPKVATPMTEPFRYDLVNTGREILAQVAGPAGQNFTAATGAGKIDAEAVKTTGDYYYQVLADVDELVNTDSAFQVGPWIEMARSFGSNGTTDTDCIPDGRYPQMSCPDFYEWNARTQLTTWNPTPKGATTIPGGETFDMFEIKKGNHLPTDCVLEDTDVLCWFLLLRERGGERSNPYHRPRKAVALLRSTMVSADARLF